MKRSQILKDAKLALVVLGVAFLLGLFVGRASAEEWPVANKPSDNESKLFVKASRTFKDSVSDSFSKEIEYVKVHTGEINNIKYVDFESVDGKHFTIYPTREVYALFQVYEQDLK